MALSTSTLERTSSQPARLAEPPLTCWCGQDLEVARPRHEGNLFHRHQVSVSLVQSRDFQHASAVYANVRTAVQ